MRAFFSPNTVINMYIKQKLQPCNSSALVPLVTILFCKWVQAKISIFPKSTNNSLKQRSVKILCSDIMQPCRSVPTFQRTLLPPSSENLKPYITLKEPRFSLMCIMHMKHNRSFTETHLKNQ